jgi:hypothetical protein
VVSVADKIWIVVKVLVKNVLALGKVKNVVQITLIAKIRVVVEYEVRIEIGSKVRLKNLVMNLAFKLLKPVVMARSKSQSRAGPYALSWSESKLWAGSASKSGSRLGPLLRSRSRPWSMSGSVSWSRSNFNR